MLRTEPGIPGLPLKSSLLSVLLLLLRFSISRCLWVLAPVHSEKFCLLHQLLVHPCLTKKWRERQENKTSSLIGRYLSDVLCLLQGLHKSEPGLLKGYSPFKDLTLVSCPALLSHNVVCHFNSPSTPAAWWKQASRSRVSWRSKAAHISHYHDNSDVRFTDTHHLNITSI